MTEVHNGTRRDNGQKREGRAREVREVPTGQRFQQRGTKLLDFTFNGGLASLDRTKIRNLGNKSDVDFVMGASPSAQPGYPTGHPGFIAAALGNKTEEEVKYFLMPVYYTTAPLLPHEKELAVKAWKEIANARAKEFWRVKNLDPEAVTCKTPMEYFGNQFFLRLFDTHPTCRGLFSKGSMREGQALLRMISFIISEIDNEEKLEKNLIALAHSHNKLGVKAVECQS
eukprot:scaffold78_cov203-Ochromonas_danica.AAC.5